LTEIRSSFDENEKVFDMEERKKSSVQPTEVCFRKWKVEDCASIGRF